jgi:ABC-2 type transport system ATP-binding protein
MCKINNMIDVKNLFLSYKSGGFTLQVEDLEVIPGEVVGVVGNNGSGKTTFFRMLLDLLKADRGMVKINGIPVNESDNWKKYSGAFLDENSLISFLTPTEYFEFIGRLNGMSEAKISSKLNDYQCFFNKAEFDTCKYISEYSKGNQHKIGIIAALLLNPLFVLLDEPFANLDPSSRLSLKSIIRDINSKFNTTFIISSHNLDHITELSSRMLLFERGRIIFDQPVASETEDHLNTYFSRSMER